MSWGHIAYGWRKSILREFVKLTNAFQEANETVLQFFGLKLGVREEYTMEYLDITLNEFLKAGRSERITVKRQRFAVTSGTVFLKLTTMQLLCE